MLCFTHLILYHPIVKSINAFHDKNKTEIAVRSLKRSPLIAKSVKDCTQKFALKHYCKND